MNRDFWLAATVLSIDETGVVNHAMHARWISESPLPCPLGPDDAGWADLYAAGHNALEQYRAAQVDRSRNGQDPQGLDAQHESAVVADDAPITGMGMSDQEGA